MADPIMADLTTRALLAALDGTAAQQRLAANNLANLETPGYRAHHASFEAQLRRALGAQRRGHAGPQLKDVPPQVQPTAGPAGPDGNTVSIEREMTALAEATARYEVITRLLDRRLAMIGVAIGDGRQS
ncbi:MAG: flagellar basal body rod protein FlgB [Armatimonadota bacterium]